MSSWMKSSFYFDDRMACFTLGRTGLCNMRVFESIKANSEDVEALEKVILGIVERCRPDLKGAMLHAVSYNQQMVAWEISLSHPSLPKRRPGDLLPRTPLVRYVEFNGSDDVVSLWNDEAIKTAMAGNADKAIMVGAKE